MCRLVEPSCDGSPKDNVESSLKRITNHMPKSTSAASQGSNSRWLAFFYLLPSELATP